MNVPVYYHEGKFPPEEIEWASLIPYIGPASAAVARYDGILGAIPNAAILLSPLMTREAVLSSRIEGTQATMGEVLEYEAEKERSQLPDEKISDINEILNYRKAMRQAVELMKKLPLSQRVIRETHKVLLEGVRGKDKLPGKYRRTPNWIGPPGCSIEEARFVPISAEKLPDAMSIWEKNIHTEAKDLLVQLALLHAELEALHPFLDGNGRIGRMFVPLFMFHAGMINSPMFYISDYLEQNRDEYYERLLSVSRNNDWTGWCLFFLKAVKHQAEENQQKAKKILALYDSMKMDFPKITKSQYSIHALDWIFSTPIFKSSDFVKYAGIPSPTAKRLITLLKSKGILKEFIEGGGRRSSILSIPSLLNIAEGYEAF